MVKPSVKHLSLLLSTIGLVVAASSCRLGDDGNFHPIDLNMQAENTISACSDGYDNDRDGLADCDDSDCQVDPMRQTVCPGKENTPFACTDGRDNDGNGYTDCKDFSCRGFDVCCISTGTEICDDGIDNNCDGKTDCRDDKCKESQHCCPHGKGTESGEEACADGIDNDCNGFVDCGDHACNGGRAGTAAAKVCEQQSKDISDLYKFSPEYDAATCSDGIDNNWNGLADCDEESCGAFCDDKVREPVARPYNFDDLTGEQRQKIRDAEKISCSDKNDNDRNGLTDCCDPKCFSLSNERKDAVRDKDIAYSQVDCKNVDLAECLKDFWPQKLGGE